jgi:hypothetical protein
MTVSIPAVPQCGVYQWLRRASPGRKSREIQDFAMMLQKPFIDRHRKSSILDTFESLDLLLPLAGNFGQAVAGGGGNPAPVYYDGANWRIG